MNPKNPKYLKLKFQTLNAYMQQQLFNYFKYLDTLLQSKYRKILIDVNKTLLKRIGILSKILAFFSMAKIEILKPLSLITDRGFV